MIIRETIHHGDFYNERQQETPDDARGALTMMGETCPYRFTFDPNANHFHAEALADLERKGRCEVGWVEYRVIARADA